MRRRAASTNKGNVMQLHMQFDKREWMDRAKRMFAGFDKPLALIVFLLLCVGIVTLYSASLDVPGRVEDQLRNIMLTFGLMWVLANIPPQTLMRFAVPMYTVGVALLLAVATFGLTKKGAKRWLNVGVVIQPSEIMKIAMPLMLAWYYQKRESNIRWWDYVVGFVILMLPVGLIAKQPDLGTAVLVFAAGVFVIYFAGLSFKLIAPVLIAVVIAVAAIATFQDRICQPEVNWPMMHDYQKHRICTLLDPTSDPLGKGFHTIQAVIAIGSGGTFGKGWLKGTQAHLEFIPEKHTDFIFAVFSEEFGLAGGLVLLFLYMALIARGLFIAANGATFFGRLLAGSLTLAFFTYAFVNIGMVSGILPVVGVPLPFMSYGGTALTTLGIAVGLIMSVARQKRLMQS
jgi:rod shape determining protein RodA